MEKIEIMTPESDFCWGMKITGYIYAVKLCFSVEKMGIAENAVPVFYLLLAVRAYPAPSPSLKVHAWIPFSLHMLKQKYKGKTNGKRKKKNPVRHF